MFVVLLYEIALNEALKKPQKHYKSIVKGVCVLVLGHYLLKIFMRENVCFSFTICSIWQKMLMPE